MRPTSGSFPTKGTRHGSEVGARAREGGRRVLPWGGCGARTCRVCKFDCSIGFDLHLGLHLFLYLIPLSYPTAGLQTGFLRMGLLWVSAPGTGPSAAPALRRALVEGGRRNQGSLVVGARVPNRRWPGLPGPEQFQEPPLVGACTLSAA